MQSAKTEFGNAYTQATTARNSVKNAKDYAVSSWTGQSATGYFRAIDSWLEQFDVVRTNLDNLTDALGAALKNYQVGEQSTGQRTSNLVSVINP